MKIKCNRTILLNDSLFDDFFFCLSAHKESHIIDMSNIEELLAVTVDNAYIHERLKRLAVLSMNRRFKYTIEVGDGIKGDRCIDISNLNRELSRKAIVIIENEHSDSCFVDCIIKCLGKVNLIKLKNVAWEFKGAGGCGEIPKVIESESNKFGGNFRAVVIHDSDRFYPGQELNKIHGNIIKKAQEKDIECHTLEKREIENYIPDSSIKDLDFERAKIVSAFEKLTSEQKDFFDYKKGFKVGGGFRGKNDPVFNGLYAALEDATYEEIKKGFGPDIAISIFGKNPHLSLDEFKARCDRIAPEFKDFCEAIERIL